MIHAFAASVGLPPMAESRDSLPRQMSRDSLRGLGALLVGLLTACYVSLWFNRYLGLTTDGWYFFFAQQWRSGLMPYRDFHLFTPPIHLFENAIFQALFGPQLIWIHVFGLIQRAALGVVLFLWTSRIARPLPSVIAAFVAIVVFSGDVNEVVIYVSQDAAFWAVVSGYLAACALGARAGGGRLALFLGSGAFASISALSKQTTGLAVTATIAAVILLRERSWRERTASVLLFSAGWLLPVAIVIRWLLENDALRSFLDQILLRGGASKGGLWATLTRPVAALFTPGQDFGRLAILALLLLVAWRAMGHEALRSSLLKLSPRLKLVMIAGALLTVMLSSATLFGSPRKGQLILCYVTLLGSIAIVMSTLPRHFRERDSIVSGDKILFGSVAAALAYSCAMSYPVWEGMAVPGLSLVLAVGLQVDRDRAADLAWLRPCVTCALVLVQLVLSIGARQLRPYSWSQWIEPPVQSAWISPSQLPALAGFTLSESSLGKLESIVHAIQLHSKPSEPVFVFPHVPFLYVLAERRPPTFGYVHFIDVAPDDLVRKDLETLTQNPPAVFVTFTRLPGSDRYNELLFRGGGRSAQRDMAAYLKWLGESPAYEKVLELPLNQVSSSIVVYARRGGATQ